MLGAALKTLAVAGLIVSGISFLAGVTTYLYGASAPPETADTLADGGAEKGAPDPKEEGVNVLGLSLIAMGASLVLLVVGIVVSRHDRAPPPEPRQSPMAPETTK